ncbi:MAG: peptidase M14, partial [Candidatus Dadabacteria bacterium]|nr:peptidase M14 [Candidatus Dadabacteria bacterium]
TVAVVKIPENIQFGFDKPIQDLCFDASIENFNFKELPAGTVIGKTHNQIENPLDIRDEQGNDISHQYFIINNGDILTRTNLIPAMITLDTDVIKKDCFCYLM